MWETAQWQPVFTRPATANALHFGDNTTLVYSTPEGRVVHENIETGKELRRVQAGAGGQLITFTVDGQQLLAVNDDRISIRNLDDGALQSTILPNLGVSNENDWVVISPDGCYIGSPNAHKYLRHIIRTKKGNRILTPVEFHNEFEWKNDPSSVRLH